MKAAMNVMKPAMHVTKPAMKMIKPVMKITKTPVMKTTVITTPLIKTTAVIKTKPAQTSQATKIARRDRIVLEHLPLVKAIAVRVHENLPVHVDLDDLVHAGVLGLFDAASKFNPEKQVAFSSYAKHRIKGAILDSLRQLDWASRDLGAVTNKWKPPRASWQPRCSARPPSLKSRRSWASTSSAGVR